MNTTFITWYDSTYGLGFVKNILAAFYLGHCKTRKGTKINKKQVEQVKLEEAFDETPGGKPFPFSQVYVLHVSDEVQYRISSRKDKSTLNFIQSEIEQHFTTTDLDEKWRSIYEKGLSLKDELAFIRQNFPEDAETMVQQLWRRINYYPFQDQWYWLTEISNLKHYRESFLLEKVDVTLRGDKPVTHLRNLPEVASAMTNWMTHFNEQTPDSRCFINVSQGNKELITAWYLLNERNYLPEDTIFFQSVLDKEHYPAEYRFRPIDFHTVDKDIFQTLPTPRIYEKARSPKRKAAQLMLPEYIKLGFAIHITGPRGTGKTKLMEDYSGRLVSGTGKTRLMEDYSGKSVESVPCELLNDETYYRDSFLGKKGTPGLLKKANNRILFLDDLHMLDKKRQLQLLTVLATDEKNQLKNYEVAPTTKITLVTASNYPLTELKQILHADFYDRVIQLVIDIPSLADAHEDRKNDWETMWRHLQFDKHTESPKPCPESHELIRWLKSLDLPGNFRDLQRIAISYKAWIDFPTDLKKYYPEIKSALEFAKQEYEKQLSLNQASEYHPFNQHTSLKEMKSNFHRSLAEWANKEFKSDQKAAEHFQSLDKDEKINRARLSDWRHGKFSKQ